MRANFVLSTLTAATLLSGAAASAAVLTVMPGTLSAAAVTGVSDIVAPTTSTAMLDVNHGSTIETASLVEPTAATRERVDAKGLADAPEPETYALIVAGLLFAGLRARSQRR